MAEPFEFLPADDPLVRFQRRMGIAPREGGGVARRALFFALLTGVPLVAWAAFTGRLLPGIAGGALLEQYALLVRCFVAIPAMILAEGVVGRVFGSVIPYLADSGIVTEADRPAFHELLGRTARLRDHTLAWILIVGLAVVAAVLSVPAAEARGAIAWGMTGGRPAFGAYWALWVARPLFMLMLLAWLWRLAVMTLLFTRLLRLDLHLVAMHPDRVGGLGPLRRISASLGLLEFAMAAVVAASVAQGIMSHGTTLDSLKGFAVLTAVLLAAVVMVPLLPFGRPLRRLRKRSMLEYGALVHRHGGMVHGRWIAGQPIEDGAILDAPELGPVADVATLYQQVAGMRTTLLGKETLIAAALPLVVPFLVVASLEIPLKDLLQKLLGALL